MSNVVTNKYLINRNIVIKIKVWGQLDPKDINSPSIPQIEEVVNKETKANRRKFNLTNVAVDNNFNSLSNNYRNSFENFRSISNHSHASTSEL